MPDGPAQPNFSFCKWPSQPKNTTFSSPENLPVVCFPFGACLVGRLAQAYVNLPGRGITNIACPPLYIAIYNTGGGHTLASI